MNKIGRVSLKVQETNGNEKNDSNYIIFDQRNSKSKNCLIGQQIQKKSQPR